MSSLLNETNSIGKLLSHSPKILDQLNRDAYIVVVINKWSKFVSIEVKSSTTAEMALHGLMEVLIFDTHMGRKLTCHYQI